MKKECSSPRAKKWTKNVSREKDSLLKKRTSNDVSKYKKKGHNFWKFSHLIIKWVVKRPLSLKAIENSITRTEFTPNFKPTNLSLLFFWEWERYSGHLKSKSQYLWLFDERYLLLLYVWCLYTFIFISNASSFIDSEYMYLSFQVCFIWWHHQLLPWPSYFVNNYYQTVRVDLQYFSQYELMTNWHVAL